MLKNEKSQGQEQFNSLAEGKIPPNPPLQKGEKEKLEQSVFATIAYYDYFNYSLTAAEIYYYLIKSDICHSEWSKSEMKNPARMCDPSPASTSTSLDGHSREILRQAQDDKLKIQNDSEKPFFLETIETLDNSDKLKRTLGRKNGFYFLAGREEIIESRIQKKKLADEKLRKSKWILSFISALPFVRFIAISGSMGIGNPDRKSDIDLLVIAKHGRIWTARAFLTFFALALGAYRHSDKTANRLCLNHYITDESLAIDFGNLYKAQEYLNLFSVSGDMSLYQKFISANAGWLEKYIYPNLENAGNENLYFIRQGKIALAIKRAAGFFLSGAIGVWLEKQFRKIQIYYIQKNPLTNHPHSRIRYADENLVFHPILVEPKIIEEYEEKIRGFNIDK